MSAWKRFVVAPCEPNPAGPFVALHVERLADATDPAGLFSHDPVELCVMLAVEHDARFPVEHGERSLDCTHNRNNSRNGHYLLDADLTSTQQSRIVRRITNAFDSTVFFRDRS